MFLFSCSLFFVLELTVKAKIVFGSLNFRGLKDIVKMRQVKSRPRNINCLPWLNSNIWSLMKQRDNALKQFLKSKMECEKHNFNKLRNRVINEIRKGKHISIFL